MFRNLRLGGFVGFATVLFQSSFKLPLSRIFQLLKAHLVQGLVKVKVGLLQIYIVPIP